MSLRATLARIAGPTLAAGALLAFASPASARIVEIGQTEPAATPSCPSTPCRAITRTTGFQAKVGPTRGLFAVPENGRIVAWTITLGTPARAQIRFFDDYASGEASAGISVLRPGRRLFGRVLAASPIVELTPYFGTTAQFPLVNSIRVRKGQLVALTVPTWAPALSLGFGGDTSWRASRQRGECDENQTQTAQTETGELTQYRCLYRTARLTYSATLITDPQRAQPEQ